MADLKTLRVCLSSELPPIELMSNDFLYFAYDKCLLYSGPNRVCANYVIASSMPAVADQVEGMIYILNTNGSVHRKIDYADTVIANIESSSQIALLRKAGTMFYINEDHRYLDSQNRSLTLPFNDGEYELNASSRKDMVYDENTILKFNPDTNRFEIYGDTTEEFIDFSKPFRGRETDTAKINVDGPRITADVKISDSPNNLITVRPDGLYVCSDGYMKKADFGDFYEIFTNFKSYTISTMEYIMGELDNIKELITPEYINAEIYRQLSSRFPTIETAIANYDAFVQEFDNLENQILAYMREQSANAMNYVRDEMEANSTWQDLDNTAYNFNTEVNYYQLAANVTTNYNGLDEDTLDALTQAAIAAYLDAESEEG